MNHASQPTAGQPPASRTATRAALISLGYALVVFTGAWLLFQIQPMMAKLLLPHFGGGAAIWSSCLFVFQLLLLGGYGYAFALDRCCPRRHQPLVHGLLLLLSLWALPQGNTASSAVAQGSAPTLAIMSWLLSSVGAPYLLLAASAPLWQRWFADQHQQGSPYRLYALSNLGSLLGLLAYPLVIEPQLALTTQTHYWSLAYLLFALLCIVLGIVSRPRRVMPAERRNQGKLSPGQCLLWLALSATGVVVLMAVTNQMTQNIAPIPFLWLLPLALYLLSFIGCFHQPRWYHRPLWGAFFGVSLFAALLLHFFGSGVATLPMLMLHSLILFSCCMICHGELAQRQPAAGQLTGFYLLVALGGALGGGFVSLAAPRIFADYSEWPLALLAVYLLLGICCQRANNDESRRSRPWLWGAGALLLVSGFLALDTLYRQHDIHHSRNFYGRLSIKEFDVDGQPLRTLVDGTTTHGVQRLDEPRRAQSYFRDESGIGRLIRAMQPRGPLNMGIIGLGAGTLASYGRPGDRVRFYELNPAVIEAAGTWFSYLADSPARLSIRQGDARLSLANEWQTRGGQGFDLLIIDAFSSDAIPLHLLTREALALYWRHLADGGVLAVHISNNHFDLAPVLRAHASELGHAALVIHTPARQDASHTHPASDWLLMSSDRTLLNDPRFADAVRRPPGPVLPVPWTDDYSHLLGALKQQVWPPARQ